MKKMFGLLAVAALFLASCGSDDKSDDTKEADDTTEQPAGTSGDDGTDDEGSESGTDGGTAGSTGLATAQQGIVAGGFPCDGAISTDLPDDDGFDGPTPTEMVECPQENGMVLVGFGWDSEDDAAEGINTWEDMACDSGLPEFSYISGSDWMMTMMEIVNEQDDEAAELLFDMAQSLDDSPTVMPC